MNYVTHPHTVAHDSMFLYDCGGLAFILKNDVAVKVSMSTTMLIRPFNG